MEMYINLAIALIILIAIIILRKDISKLVNWIVSFRKVTKGEKGLSLEGFMHPEKPKEIEISYLEKEGEICKEESQLENNKKNWIELLFKKEYDESINTIEELIKDSDNQENKIDLESCKGHVLLTQNFKIGVEYFNKLIKEYPENQNPYRWYALSLYWNGNYEKCLEIIEQGLANAEKKSGLITVKANCLDSMARENDAITLLISSIENNTDIPLHYQKLCDLIKDDLEAKYSWFKKGIAEYPNDKTLKEDFALFLNENEKYGEAVLQYNDLIDIEPENPRYLTLLANSFLSLDLHSKALETYKKANKFANSEQGWILANIGNIYNNKGFHFEAISCLRKAIEIEPDSEYNHDRLASALKLQNKEEEKLRKIVESARAVDKFKSDVTV